MPAPPEPRVPAEAPGGCGRRDRAGMKYALFSKHTTNEWSLQETTWPELAMHLADHKPGSKQGSCFACGLFNGTRSGEAVTTRALIALDIEPNKKTGEMPPPPQDISARIKAKGWDGVVHTSHSHTIKSPRYRIVMPLAVPFDFPSDGHAEARAIDAMVVKSIADALGLASVLDLSKCSAESLFFLPRHPEGAAHYAEIVAGEPLDYGPLYEAARAEHEEREQRYKAASRTKPKRQKAGPIAAYNASVDLPALLLDVGYMAKPGSSEHFRSPNQTTKSYATRLYPDGRWVSLSGSDAVAGLGMASTAGNARCGDAFDIFSFYKHNNDAKAALAALENTTGVSLKDFHAYMPQHCYIFAPTGEPWPARSVNSRLLPVGKASASDWLDRNRPVEQMTWAPGEPPLIYDRLIADGGWIKRRGVTCFNLYRPPTIEHGNAREAGPWLKLVNKLFPEDADHIIKYAAQRVQQPGDKINHVLFLGGEQGIGKDTILEPLKYAVGHWNFKEVSPQELLGRFNSYVKATILRISEARDLGELNRYQFYEHMKIYSAAPPDVLRCDEKHLREYSVQNCCGVVITSNYKSDGIYLPPTDRRTYVAWSDLKKDDFDDDYWNGIWGWYRAGGFGHVAAFLAQFDISEFDCKAPPPKTRAFWDIVDANRSPEDAELADTIDALGNPAALTLEDLKIKADASFVDWLNDRRNRRVIPHRLEQCGYERVRNPDADSGLFVIVGKRQVVYGKVELSLNERLRAATALASAPIRSASNDPPW